MTFHLRDTIARESKFARFMYFLQLAVENIPNRGNPLSYFSYMVSIGVCDNTHGIYLILYFNMFAYI